MSPPLPEAKKRLILDATRLLLIERGFQDIVLDDVASRAGVAKGTLFLYFRSKDELFTAAFADLIDQLGSALEGLPRAGLRGRALLVRTVRTILAHFERNRDFMSHFGAGKFPSCGERSCEKLMAKMSDNVKRVVRILRLCSQDGLGRFKLTPYAAMGLFGLCRSAMLHKALTGHESPLERRASFVTDLFLYGVRGRK